MAFAQHTRVRVRASTHSHILALSCDFIARETKPIFVAWEEEEAEPRVKWLHLQIMDPA